MNTIPAIAIWFPIRLPYVFKDVSMQDRKKTLWLTVLALLLPGPWTPVIVLAYILDRAAERDQHAAHHDWALPDPYACVPAGPRLNPYAPPR